MRAAPPPRACGEQPSGSTDFLFSTFALLSRPRALHKPGSPTPPHGAGDLVSHSGSAALGTKGGPTFPSPHGGNRTMARGRRGKRRLSRRDKRSHHNRTRRALSPAVPLAAVPVGLVLAAALIIVTGKGRSEERRAGNARI